MDFNVKDMLAAIFSDPYYKWPFLGVIVLILFMGVRFIVKNANQQLPNTTMNTPDTTKEQSGGIINHAPNYGNQAGRDMYIGTDRELTSKEISEITSGIKDYINEFKLKGVIVMGLSQESNGKRAIVQLQEALIKSGYQVSTGASFFSNGTVPLTGISYNHNQSDGVMIIQVGILPDPE